MLRKMAWGLLPLAGLVLMVGCLAQTEGSGADTDLPTSTPVADALQAPAPVAGRPAPDFALPDLEGNEVRLSELKGKVVLVNFWATW